MTRIFYTDISFPRNETAFNTYLDELPESLKNKVLKFRRWQDAYASLFGKLLLKAALLNCGFSSFTFDDLQYTSFNRPFIEGNIDFNLSHSGAFIVCVLSNEDKVGIDIEEVKSINLGHFESQFTADEWLNITNATDPYSEFYSCWTKKEAILKASGEGLNMPLKQVQLFDDYGILNKNKWYIKEYHLANNYSVHLASEIIINPKIVPEKIDFP
ncbi:4'-phosphopantetheinyl transferase [Mucilaginibacter mallensis]|uniref:4'-phosphopantetheinyl transferase n=1 Tax=Mucilaginibacter mallensis TaxID=652787 RepID=A0A1H1S8V9_MUCMA|nr:4'-phosphopantetheinyl transferase superfamily protein [Mucilaginibacter mallensis]SDS43749.1 4'-phosphopantetheinyl transferase [Mucilaginibacter mallensis]